MAGCLSCREKGNVSPENVKRWTKRLSYVLRSTTARNRFKSYLTERNFKDGLLLVEFWEMCDRLDARCTETGAADGVDQSAEAVLEEAEQIAQFAEDNIAFDAEMIGIKDALKSGDTEQIKTAFSVAKQRAAEMLEDKNKGYYEKFCQYLLREKGLLREGD